MDKLHLGRLPFWDPVRRPQSAGVSSVLSCDSSMSRAPLLCLIRPRGFSRTIPRYDILPCSANHLQLQLIKNDALFLFAVVGKQESLPRPERSPTMMLNQRLFTLTQGVRWRIAGVVAVGLAVTGTYVGQGLLSARAVGSIFEGAPWSAVLPLLVGITVLIIARMGLLWLHEISAKATAAAAKQKLRRRLYAHLLLLGPGYLVRTMTLLGFGNSLTGGAVLSLLVVYGVRGLGLPKNDARIGFLLQFSCKCTIVVTISKEKHQIQQKEANTHGIISTSTAWLSTHPPALPDFERAGAGPGAPLGCSNLAESARTESSNHPSHSLPHP